MKSEQKFSADKNSLRSFAKKIRAEIVNRNNKDLIICDAFFSLDEYKKCKVLLCYVTLGDEVDTDNIIKKALSDGKRIAVPCCTDKVGNMEFYYINCFDDLSLKSFGIREPNPDYCQKVCDFSNAVIIVPGLCFDADGNRLGYGRGYYDRFLQKHPLFSVGLCYNNLIVDNVPTDCYDKKMNVIITDTDVYRINGG